jgi:hypothetical protein
MDIVSRTSSDFLGNSEVWIVESIEVGDRFRVCIAGPEMPLPDGLKLGAVVATDAAMLAGTLSNTLRACGFSGDLPPLFAISIGYPVDSEPSHLVKRTRDLTPTARPDYDPVAAMIMGGSEVVASGGADAFLRFVTNELLPVITEQFPIDPADLTLIGASFGGLFTLHALQSNPAAFQRYLAISPSIWWDDRLILRREQEAGTAPYQEARLYMCVGELESITHARAQMAALPPAIFDQLPQGMREADMHRDMLELHSVLVDESSLGTNVQAHIFPEETHMSIVGAGISRGLRWLYGTL